jgi:hypothetical protein
LKSCAVLDRQDFNGDNNDNGQPLTGEAFMRHNKALAALTIVLVLLGAAAFRISLEAQQPSAPAALTGTVRSAKEGLMEGVLVSARQSGSPIATTVVTNAQGVYAFPQGRLSPGNMRSRFARSVMCSTRLLRGLRSASLPEARLRQT